MSLPHTAPPALPPPIWMLVMGVGLVLLLPGVSDRAALAGLARAASTDGQLGDHLQGLLTASQSILGALLLVVPPLAWVGRRAVDAGFERLRRQSDRRLALILGVAAALGAWSIQGTLFGHLPHITDAISHTFQARIFAGGEFWAPAPPSPAAFAQYNLVISPEGKWHTKYAPGHALLLAPGAALGLEPLVLPLAWGATVALFFVAAARFRPRAESLLATALLAGSPLGLLAAASFMSHTTFLFCCTAAFALGSGRLDAPRLPVGRSLAAGLLAGWAALARPQDVPAAALFVGLLILIAPPALRRAAVRRLPVIVLGALPAAAALLAWNRYTYGGALASGYNFGQLASYSPVIRDSMGFSAEYPVGQAVRQAAWTLLRFNKALWGWPSSLLLLPLAFLAPGPRRAALVLLAPVVGTVLLYATFPYYGMELEARYYTFGLPFLALLTAQAVRALADRVSAPRRAAFLAALLGVCGLHALLFYWPRQIWPAYAGAYEYVQPGLDQAVAEAGLRRAVVLVGTGDPNDLSYSSGFVHNTPRLDGEVIYARDIPEQQAALRAAFPDRSFHRARWAGGRFHLEPVTPAP